MIPADAAYCACPTVTGRCGQRATRIAVWPGTERYYPACAKPEHLNFAAETSDFSVMPIRQLLFLGVL